MSQVEKAGYGCGCNSAGNGTTWEAKARETQKKVPGCDQRRYGDDGCGRRRRGQILVADLTRCDDP